MRKIALIALVAMSFHSCKEFLSPYSPNEYVPQTVEALQETLVGTVYISTNDSNVDLFKYNEFMSDNVEISDNEFLAASSGTEANSLARSKELFCLNSKVFELAEQGLPGVSVSSLTWEDYFKKILGCNVVFDYIESVRGTEEQKNIALGEAYFFRAFLYFNFVNIYGEPYAVSPNSLGVPIKKTSRYSPDYLKRNTVAEVYELIESDLAEAEKVYEKLDRDNQFKDNILPSLVSVYLFRSRVALYMEKWELAASYADKVIKNEFGFELYDLNFFQKEPIKGVAYPFYTNSAIKNCESIYLYGSAYTVNKMNLQGVQKKGEGNNNTNSDWKLYFYKAASDLMTSFDDEDLRKEYYVVREYNTKGNPAGEINDSYLPFGKLCMNAQNTILGGGDSYFGFAMRISEAYLNYAEASAKLNRTDDAISAIKTLRENRYKHASAEVEVLSLSGEELVEFIRVERRKELCFEGHRWFDQKRYGMKAFTKKWYEQGELLHIIQVGEKDAAFTLPITPAVLRNNLEIHQNKTWEAKY